MNNACQTRRISVCADITAAQHCIKETNLPITADELDATPEHKLTRRGHCARCSVQNLRSEGVNKEIEHRPESENYHKISVPQKYKKPQLLRSVEQSITAQTPDRTATT
jgi:hypothetical protein